MFTQLIRIGRDAELRYTPKGDPVCSIAGAYDIGYGDKKRAQWVDCSLWGKRAESLVQYLTKGQQCMVTLDDVEVETYEGKNGPGAKLKGRVVDIKLCGGNPSESRQQPQQQAQQPQQQAQQPQQQAQQPQQQAQQPQQQAQQPQTSTMPSQQPAPDGHDDFNMDIPF